MSERRDYAMQSADFIAPEKTKPPAG